MSSAKVQSRSHQLTRLSTQLSFCWTLPLSTFHPHPCVVPASTKSRCTPQFTYCSAPHGLLLFLSEKSEPPPPYGMHGRIRSLFPIGHPSVICVPCNRAKHFSTANWFRVNIFRLIVSIKPAAASPIPGTTQGGGGWMGEVGKAFCHSIFIHHLGKRSHYFGTVLVRCLSTEHGNELE
jgi:hypothetical protein